MEHTHARMETRPLIGGLRHVIFRLLIGVVFAAGLLGASPARAESPPSWTEESLKFGKKLDQWEKEGLDQTKICHRTWDFLWKWAKKGEPQAFNDIAEWMASSGLIPPNVDKKIEEYFKYIVVFAAHASRSPSRAGTYWLGDLKRVTDEDLQKVSRMFPFFKFMGPFRTCLQTKDLKACVRQAIEQRYFPTIEELIRTIDGEDGKTARPLCEGPWHLGCSPPPEATDPKLPNQEGKQ